MALPRTSINAIKIKLDNAVSAKDPRAIAAAVNLPAFPKIVGAARNSGVAGSQHREHLKVDGVDWSNVLNPLLDAHLAIQSNDLAQIYEAQSSLHSSLNHVLGSSKGNWLIPALHVVCRNTHRAAALADEHVNRSTGNRNDHKRLQNAVTLLQASYSKTLNDRVELRPNEPFSEEGSKKAGVLYIVNQLFSMYFRLNTLRLCKNLQKPVESRGIHESGTMGEMVTYRYYVGRLNMFEDQYDMAEQNFDYALRHCHHSAVANKKRILNYLVPVKLLRGRLPTSKLLEKYSLHEFVPLSNGMRTGNLMEFSEGLMKNQDLFIRRGTYLLLEKCKMICYRNLFKRVYKIVGKEQIKLDHIAKSFKWLGMPIDLDEVECILANLIYKQYIRGYLSHAKRILVLSKKEPFPTSKVIKQ
eukprot:CAMPEP_0172577488 /NCGR_PEP_ID=MMETSP1067-20121228/138258_1 /TAXON_ID=265564 ORGANISM="Thalassiosira punctigera, Strain Tpunct2005C2" /NCGR_SAMPLE_ID=MMETSP1067 /ASSEMBLY_ACC=CAM_ASM_000444 /LENGTH=412 /DNA_ID=CAMNT_0013370175 /DNA_START=1078 /DNA_END=2316 /DNA_ORIENTATION=-